MKLVIAIVHDEDSHRLLEVLNEEKFQVTKLASTGGFLRSGNTTFLIGTEEQLVSSVIEIISRECNTRKELKSVPVAGDPHPFMSAPIEVITGGATVFVVDVEKYLKL